MKTIVLATSNPGKLREIQRELTGLDVRVLSLADLPALPEPVEDGATFEANARLKARAYSLASGHWCLADDSGLVVDALAGAPGVFSARFAADRCPPGAPRETLDRANNALLLERLAATPDEGRSARFVCCLALADGERIVLETRGEVHGRIARRPAGSNGFGYDPLFLLSERGVTTAQLSPAEKNAISHRGRAVRQFREMLEQLLK